MSTIEIMPEEQHNIITPGNATHYQVPSVEPQIRKAILRLTTPRPKIGRTPIDINRVLKDHTNDPAYLSQLHYNTQYDRGGYPQLRKEFVDYLEASLDAQKSADHILAFKNIKLADQAIRALIVYKPELWMVYRAAVLDGMSINEIAESFLLYERKIIKMLIIARATVEKAYQRATENARKQAPVSHREGSVPSLRPLHPLDNRS